MRCKQKILALLLAVALVLAMSSTALADGEVCAIGDKKYTSLQAAVDTVEEGTEATIILLDDTTGGGVKVKSGQNIIFELGGHAYTVNEKTVGSSGTETNGFQLLKGSTVTFQNGTIYAGGSARILLQNYANLTLKDVTLDARGNTKCEYVSSNNCGTVNITGNTNIYAAEGQAAFDVYYWPSGGYTDGVIVTVNTTGTIGGRIEYTNDGTAGQDVVAEQAKLIIKSGKFSGPFRIDEEEVGKAGITISGGSFATSDTSTITPYLDHGFELVGGQVVSASSHDDDDDGSIGYPPPTILYPTGNQVVAVMANGTVTLSVEANGVGYGGYQWFVNRGDGLGFVPVAGATGYSLTLYPTFADNGSQYYCRVMNGYGYVDSGCFTLSVVGGMVPKTGDQVSVTLWVCLMALGVAGAAAALARRRSR